jgi:CheY-like chemotaxis protein
MDGLTCASHLRDLGYTPRIIALTAHDESSKRDECLMAGFSAFMAKPFNTQQLLEVVNVHATKKHNTDGINQ